MELSLEQQLVEMIVEACYITDPVPEDLSYEAPLIGPDSPFGLDSLDAIEIVVAVQRTFGVRIEAEESARKVLVSLQTLADFIRQMQQNQ